MKKQILFLLLAMLILFSGCDQWGLIASRQSLWNENLENSSWSVEQEKAPLSFPAPPEIPAKYIRYTYGNEGDTPILEEELTVFLQTERFTITFGKKDKKTGIIPYRFVHEFVSKPDFPEVFINTKDSKGRVTCKWTSLPKINDEQLEISTDTKRYTYKGLANLVYPQKIEEGFFQSLTNKKGEQLYRMACTSITDYKNYTNSWSHDTSDSANEIITFDSSKQTPEITTELKDSADEGIIKEQLLRPFTDYEKKTIKREEYLYLVIDSRVYYLFKKVKP